MRCGTIGARTAVISVAISKHQRFLLHTDSSLQLLISWQTCLRAVLPRKRTPASRAQQVSRFLADIVAHWDHSPLRDRLWFGYSSLVPSNNPSSWQFGRGQFFEECPIQVRTTPFRQTQSIFLACTRRMYLHTQWSSIFHQYPFHRSALERSPLESSKPILCFVLSPQLQLTHLRWWLLPLLPLLVLVWYLQGITWLPKTYSGHLL